MRGEARSRVLARLAGAALALRLPHPTRVAIDGRSAAGKTTLADELASVLRKRGRQVLRASIDDFHPPGYKHLARRRAWTPEAYCEQGYDFEAFRELLLRPLGPGGDRRCRTGLHDPYHDRPLPEEWHEVSSDAIAVVDGAFLLRPDLAGHWDLSIWLDIDWETLLDRARRRDVTWVGSERAVVERYERHWIPVHRLYERTSRAPEIAHAVVDNRCIDAPRLVRLDAARSRRSGPGRE